MIVRRRSMLARSFYLPDLTFSFLSSGIPGAWLGWKGGGMDALSAVLGGVRIGNVFGMGFDARGTY